MASTISALFECMTSYPEFLVQLDTGSADLVLFPDRPIETSSVINDSQINATYGTGWYAGPIAIAKLEFSGHTVESQGMCHVRTLMP